MLPVNPSYDFRLFDVGWMSPLQANEFGAATSFRASDPTSFVDFSLNQLAGLLNPSAAYPYPQRQLPAPIEEVPFLRFFQGESAEATRERLRRVREEADRLLREAGGNPGVNIGDVFRGRTVRSGEGTGPIVGDKVLKNDGKDAPLGDDPTGSGKKMGALADWWKALPQGAGVFLIGVAALIFILLFARK